MVATHSGKDLAGALVQLSAENSPASVLAMRTDIAGEFKFVAVPAGFYTLAVTLPGWRDLLKARMEVRPAGTLEVRIILLPSSQPGASSFAEFSSRDVGWGTAFGDLSLRQLPNSGNVWSLLENQEPSSVTNRIDVGGLATGAPALFGALGASWTENQYFLNRLNVTDPYLPGWPIIEPDLDALSEVSTLTGAKPAHFGAAGANLLLSTPEPRDAFHGSTRWFYSGQSLQSDPRGARLAQLYFPGPERFKHFVDGDVQLGGKLPLPSAPWPFFTSLSTQQLSKTLGGFDAPIDVHVYRALTEVTPISQGGGRLNLLYSAQHIFNSREGADLRIAPASTTLRNDNFHQFQARGERALGSAVWLAAGFGVAHAIISSGIQPGLTELSAIDMPQMARTGAAPLSNAGVRTRYQADALLQAVHDGPVGSHSLALGGEWERSDISNRWDALGGLERTTVYGVGVEVTLWNTPTAARAHTQNVAVFAQDAWRPVRWLRLPLGLRLENSSGRAGGAGRGIRWTTLEPRAGLVFPLHRRGPALRASWSRYGHVLQGRYLDFGNRAALGGQVFRWDDVNSDLAVQPGEIGPLLTRFGGLYSAIDRGLARPFTDEVSVGLDQEFGSGFRASVRFFRRDTHRRIALSNVGVPAADYATVIFPDPGNDGVPGTADDQLLTLYNRNPDALGQDFLLLTNPPGLHGSFKGFEIRLVKPLRDVWEFTASFTAMRTLAATNPGNSVFENDPEVVGALGTDPNTFVMATSRTYFDRAFVSKATGYYFAPKGFQLGFVAKYYDGLPFGRLVFVDGFNQGPFFVRATPRAHPGGFQTQFNFTLDTRVAREFRLRRGTLSGYLDFFNLLNLEKNTLEADLTGPTFELRVPLAIQAPRAARLGIEWRF
ncbi:MAG: hypothetical protein LAO07_08235 [Acidobacteriia bacterium]|nr:hypothetical protein [Terriglobia bacterium]